MNAGDSLTPLVCIENLVGLSTAGVLLIALVVLLPRQGRRTLYASAVLFTLYLITLGLRVLVLESSSTGAALRLCSYFFLYCFLGRAAFLLISQTFCAKALSKAPRIFLDVVHGLVYLICLFITLSMAGVSVGSLLTGSVALTVVVGLSLRETLGNVVAGLALEAEHVFQVGDWIQDSNNPDHDGKVTEINWRATVIVTQDQIEITLPHAMLAQNAVINITHPERYTRRELYFHAPYDVSPQRIHQVVLQSLRNTSGIIDDPAPSVVTFDFDERGIKYWLRYYIAEIERRSSIASAVHTRVWYALCREGIPFPPTLRDVEILEVEQH